MATHTHAWRIINQTPQSIPISHIHNACQKKNQNRITMHGSTTWKFLSLMNAILYYFFLPWSNTILPSAVTNSHGEGGEKRDKEQKVEMGIPPLQNTLDSFGHACNPRQYLNKLKNETTPIIACFCCLNDFNPVNCSGVEKEHFVPINRNVGMERRTLWFNLNRGNRMIFWKFP